VDVDVRDGVSSPASIAALARAIAGALDAVRAPSPASIGLILTDDAEIAALNVEHMAHEGPTDVLSFPLLPPSAFGPGRAAPDIPRPPGSRIHLGDIVVSVARAIDQASTGRGGQTGDVHWSPSDELRLLVTHGTLHICGWDHATPSDEREMRALEQRLLGASGGHDR
jgi:probable rRNA maturation factor